jgi:hypothetical protein
VLCIFCFFFIVQKKKACDADEKSPSDYADESMKILFQVTRKLEEKEDVEDERERLPAISVLTNRIVLFEDEVLDVLVGGVAMGASELEVEKKRRKKKVRFLILFSKGKSERVFPNGWR